MTERESHSMQPSTCFQATVAPTGSIIVMLPVAQLVLLVPTGTLGTPYGTYNDCNALMLAPLRTGVLSCDC